ncbi:MAG: hypothetical protein ACFN9G_10570 [Cardiobacterium sp.]
MKKANLAGLALWLLRIWQLMLRLFSTRSRKRVKTAAPNKPLKTKGIKKSSANSALPGAGKAITLPPHFAMYQSNRQEIS